MKSYEPLECFKKMKQFEEENEKLKNTLRNIRMYLVDKTCNLSKAKQLITDSQAVMTDLIAREEAYSDILVYIERKGIE